MEDKKAILRKALEQKKESIKRDKKELKEKNKKKVNEVKKKKVNEKKCKTCLTPFIPLRKTQIYCSDKCAEKANNLRIKNKLTSCNNCQKLFPRTAINKNGLCIKCESIKKVCKYCWEEFFAEKKDRVYCCLRCNALDNQKKASRSKSWPKHNLQDMIDELVPLLQYDCTLEEACNQTGWSYWTIKDYLYKDRNTEEYPELLEFRKQIKKAMQYIKIVARKTLVEAVVTKKDVNSAKYIISNRDKRYQGGVDENGDAPTKKIVFKFDVEPSPFIQPVNRTSEKEKEYTEDDIEIE